MGRNRKFTDEQVIQAVPKSRAISHVLDYLGLRPAGGNYLTIQKKIKQLGLDTSHFHGSAWRRGKPSFYNHTQSLESILVQHSTYVNTMKLKKKLLQAGIFQHRCMACQLDAWLSQPIPLELHHVNGDRMDHRLENLQLLCPNCHALTPTYRARNKGRVAIATNG